MYSEKVWTILEININVLVVGVVCISCSTNTVNFGVVELLAFRGLFTSI